MNQDASAKKPTPTVRAGIRLKKRRPGSRKTRGDPRRHRQLGCRRPSARAQADQTLRQLVKKLFAGLNKPGVRRLQAELRVRGWQVSKKRVWRLMRLGRLAGRHPRTRNRIDRRSRLVWSAAGSWPSGWIRSDMVILRM
jgi:hypothetical protein